MPRGPAGRSAVSAPHLVEVKPEHDALAFAVGRGRAGSPTSEARSGLARELRGVRLNLGTADTEVSVLLDAGLWTSIEGESTRAGPCVWGVDLGTSAAQSAVASYWPATGRLESVAAFPAEPSLADRGLRDGVGRLYSECARRGELMILGQRSADILALLQAARERFGRPARIVADRWREAELRDALDRAGIPLASFEVRGMGFKDGAEDVRGFRKGCADGRVVPVPSLLLRSAMAEARTVSDPAGNAKLCKGSQGGRRVRARMMQRRRRSWPLRPGATTSQAKRRWRYHRMAG